MRSLAQSVGKRLGCGGTVLSLRRESIAGFSVADALTLEQVKGLSKSGLEALLAGSMRRLDEFVFSLR